MEVDLKKYKLSTHCKQRYAERIMGRDIKSDVHRYITDNEEKMQIDVNKMITYGELIFTGRQSQKDGKGKVVDVYLKDSWVVLVDSRDNVVITLYKIDLGLDEEFNKVYIEKMMDKLQHDKENLENVRVKVEEDADMYKTLIEEAEIQINEHKSIIKNLEELVSGYKTIIEGNRVKNTLANRQVADTLNTFLGKKEF